MDCKLNSNAIIFDFDGVIVDTEPIYLEAMQKMAKRRGKVFTLDLKKEVMGTGGLVSMGIMKEALELKEAPKKLLEEREKTYQALLFEQGVRPMPGLFYAIDIIDKLGFRKAIASASRIKFIEFALRTLNITKEFEVIAHGEEVAKGKPAPDIFILVLNKLNLTANKCIVLEDTLPGIKAAKSAGLKCIAIPNQYNSDANFSQADVVLKSFEELSENMIMTLLR